MSLLTKILGRKNNAQKNRENYFSIIQAYQELQSNTQLKFGDVAGLLVNKENLEFLNTQENNPFFKATNTETLPNSSFSIEKDDHSTNWVIIHGENFPQIVERIHFAGEKITDQGFGDLILAAVFCVEYTSKKTYIIFNVKSAQFHPLVLEDEKTRDNMQEINLGTLLGSEKIPIEKNLELWHPLWGIPF